MTSTRPFRDLVSQPYKRWYQFGFPHSLDVLYGRLRHKYRPIRRARMMWQRALNGYSDEDLWSLDHFLARATVAGVTRMREGAHGYPSEAGSIEAWDEILAQIQTGFQAWLDADGWFLNDEDREADYRTAMALFAHWFGALWD